MIEFNLKAKEDNLGAMLLGAEMLAYFEKVEPAGLTYVDPSSKMKELMCLSTGGLKHEAWKKVMHLPDWKEQYSGDLPHGLSVMQKDDKSARIYFCWNTQMWHLLSKWNNLLLYISPSESVEAIVGQLWKLVVCGYKCVKQADGKIVLMLGKLTEEQMAMEHEEMMEESDEPL